MIMTKKVLTVILFLLLIGTYMFKQQNNTVVKSNDLFSNSVVSIVVYTNESDSPTSQGNGVAISPHLILTNYHVVKYPQKIFLNNNQGKIGEAKLIAWDLKSDLAILQTDTNLKPVLLSNKKVKKGSIVNVAHKNRLEKGKIIDVNQSIPGYLGSILKYLKIINVDSEHGSSGGAVLNSKGELVGILSAKLEENNIVYSYAIPLYDANTIIQSLLKQGKFEHIILGIEAKEFISNNNINNGIIVSKVLKNTVAYGKLLEGDIITSVNGKKINTLHDLACELFKTKKHDGKIILNIIREQKKKRLEFKINVDAAK